MLFNGSIRVNKKIINNNAGNEVWLQESDHQ